MAFSRRRFADRVLPAFRRMLASIVLATALVVPMGHAATVADDLDVGLDSAVQTLALQADGKIFVGGWFTAVDGDQIARLVRLHPDGRIDSTFTAPSFNGTVYSVVPLADGKTIVTGNFSFLRRVGFPFLPTAGVVRLKANGSIDTTFFANATSNGSYGNVFRALPLASGKLLIGGHFTSVNGVARNKLARLNADGSTDATFSVGSMATPEYVWAMAERPDGRIVVGGHFQGIGGGAGSNLAQLHVNGSRDMSFLGTAGFANGMPASVSSVLIQADGRVVVTGRFDRIRGEPRSNVARLNANGTSPVAYPSYAPPNAQVHWAALQPDGKVVIGGDFTKIGALPWSKLARIDVNGNVDGSFEPPVVNGNVWSVAVQADGKVIAGGNFVMVGDVARTHLARIYGRPLVPFADAKQISIGDAHACAVTLGGAVECWGDNEHGELGIGSTNSQSIPAVVSGLESGVTAVAVGSGHTCALMSTGTVKWWGWNPGGEVGDGSTMSRSVPVTVTDLVGATHVAAGTGWSCARTNIGAIKCWGRSIGPVPVIQHRIGSVQSILASSRSHVCVEWLCFSPGASAPETDYAVEGVPFAIGALHRCAIYASVLTCAGANDQGQLGRGTQFPHDAFMEPVGLDPYGNPGMQYGYTDVVAGMGHTCAIRLGAVLCWGDNGYGQTGPWSGSVPDPNRTVTIATRLATSMYSTCALHEGAIRCWGANHFGQLGNGTRSISSSVRPVMRYIAP